MTADTELLREIRDLLRVLAEPALAERDSRLRTSLAGIVGRNKSKAAAVALMDGSKTQKTICQETRIDSGDLSRLVKTLRESALLAADEKPKLIIPIPQNLSDKSEKKNG